MKARTSGGDGSRLPLRVCVVLAVLAAFLPMFLFGAVQRLHAARSTVSSTVWFPNWIGLPWSGDSLSRMQVTDHSEIDFVFTATETSTLVSISPWIVANNPKTYPPCPPTVNEDLCYSAGHGGTIRVDVYADDPKRNLPTGPSLGSHTWERPMVNGAIQQEGNFDGSWFGPLELTPAPQVEAGQTYHAVWTNPDRDAAAGNFYGLNFLSNRAVLSGDLHARAQMPIVSWNRWDARFRGRKSSISPEHFTNNEWRSCGAPQVASKYMDCWATRDGWYRQTPIVQYKYGNGKEFGNGYAYPTLGLLTWGNNPTDGTTRSRQTFRVDSPTLIDQVGVRINPVTAGSAKFSVRRISDDEVLASVNVSYALPPTMGGTSDGSCLVGVRCGNNGLTLIGQLPPTSLPAGEYYIDFDRADGAVYAPQVMIAYRVQPGNKLPEWGPGTRWESGELENWTGSEWRPIGDRAKDAFAYLRTTTPELLAAAAATTTLPAPPKSTLPAGASGVASTDTEAKATKSTKKATKRTTKKPTRKSVPATKRPEKRWSA